MSLYIGGKPYASDAAFQDLLDAVQRLPSPLQDVKNDYDSELYTLEASRGFDRLIKTKHENKKIEEIKSKDGRIFSKRSQLDPEAYSVGQGDVGYMSKGKMGTTNVQDCVAMIVKDKLSKQTALAHVHCVTREAHLQNLLSYMPKGRKKVILIGGRHERGEYNVEKILRVLADYGDNVVINKAYVNDKAYIHDESYNFVESCYELNTGFGDIVVEVSSLQVSVGLPTREFSEHSKSEESPAEKHLLCLIPKRPSITVPGGEKFEKTAEN